MLPVWGGKKTNKQKYNHTELNSHSVHSFLLDPSFLNSLFPLEKKPFFFLPESEDESASRGLSEAGVRVEAQPGLAGLSGRDPGVGSGSGSGPGSGSRLGSGALSGSKSPAGSCSLDMSSFT